MSFPTTHWTRLAQGMAGGESAGRSALADLCERYSRPLNHFIRSRGYSEVEAQDLTQGFLLHLLENATLRKANPLRGKFRSFLIGALQNFLSHDRQHRFAKKRGGEFSHIAFELVSDDENGTGPQAAEIASFDRVWAMTVLQRALERLKQDYEAAGKSLLFDQLRAFLPGGSVPPSYEEAAKAAGMSVAAFNSEIHRFRLQFRKSLWTEVIATVSAPHETDEEISYLYQVLMDRGTDLSQS